MDGRDKSGHYAAASASARNCAGLARRPIYPLVCSVAALYRCVVPRGAGPMAPFLFRNSLTRIAMEDASQLTDAATREIAAAMSSDALEEVRIKYLGRRGSLTAAMRGLGGLEPEARRRAGAELNLAKDRIAAALAEAATRLNRAALEERLAAERADVTLPVAFDQAGPHPSDQPDDRRDRRDLWRDGVCRRRGAAYRGGFLQFHRTQHPARSPGAPGARHLLSARARRRQPAGLAHPHLAGADPHHAGATAADPDHRAGPHLPLRP